MFDLHSEIYKFYRDRVRLTSEQRSELAGYRNTNYERLKTGLDKLEYPRPVRKCDQGSYAMHTTNQHPENEYDIDSAIIFDKDDLPSSPLDARRRIESAMKEGGGNFSQPPEARTNAVTVWYQEGYHVDLAIHRRYFDGLGNEIIEHAGVEWTQRDPMDITNWFNNLVVSLSPSKDNGATVASGQMRRIVQLLKMFAKSRKSWNLPSGLVISTLVGKECYRPNYYSDEKALYETIISLHNRLQASIEVKNPVDDTQLFTYKSEYTNQVINLRDQLKTSLDWLEPLLSSDCDKESAVKVWKQFFRHEYWDELLEQITEAKLIGEALRSTAYVTSSGKVSPTPPTKKHIEVPSHRYYGDS
jgi:hypothetical protein